jgi:AraC family transcriptional regulator of adaptative response / DNA-3-methyladenine glycosylase II
MSENGERSAAPESIMRAMTLDPDSCYRALVAHDPRFDGKFFVGVSSTRIYCRPVCTVRAPRREHCRFFPSAAAAEVHGYRPCLRCRPELAPGHAGVDATARIARAAVDLIDDGTLDEGDVEGLAARIGVTSRHLRRVFDEAFGVTPIAYAQTHRLLLAKHLLTDTALPVTDVALASGFQSLRRFNALFKARYRMPPSRLRAAATPSSPAPALVFALGFRPPYDWDAMLDFLRTRAIGGVEDVGRDVYRRTVALDAHGVTHRGWIEVRRSARRAALAVSVAPSLARVVPAVLARVKHAFDLDCDPAAVAAALGPLAQERPGLRVPGGCDGFEVAVRAIVGQQITVRGARMLLGRIAEAFGDAVEGPAALTRLFPSAAQLAAAAEPALARLGLPRARARTIVAIAHAVAERELELTAGADVEATLAKLVALPGVGEWTAHYIAMRALGWPDAFLPTDVGVLRALDERKPARALARSEAWRPWRSYAVIHLWRKNS